MRYSCIAFHRQVIMSTATSDSTKSPWHPKVFITGHNAAGQAVVHDSYACPEKVFAEHAFTNHHLYSTSSMPVDLNKDVDIEKHQAWVSSQNVGITIQNGTVCRFVNLAPGHRPLSHRTQSLDFGIVTDGSVVMELDDGSSTRLNTGDVVVQRGTMHAWRNPSQTQWARMVFFLQDCKRLEGVQEDLGHEGGLNGLFPATYEEAKS